MVGLCLFWWQVLGRNDVPAPPSLSDDLYFYPSLWWGNHRTGCFPASLSMTNGFCSVPLALQVIRGQEGFLRQNCLALLVKRVGNITLQNRKVSQSPCFSLEKYRLPPPNAFLLKGASLALSNGRDLICGCGFPLFLRFPGLLNHYATPHLCVKN